MSSTVEPQSTVGSPYEDLPRANVRPHQHAFPDSEFVLIPNVPVFAEHTATRKDGTQLKFGLDELRLISDRCNRRIRETGDYASLSLGHTPDPGEANGQEPEVVGYAGPFRVGLLGEPGVQQKYAILADFHVHKSDADNVRKRYTRRSPELWLADSYEEMFLDPIALLSSKPPKLDMGLLYAAEYQGRTVEKYTAVAPAAGSVFVPSDDYAKQWEEAKHPRGDAGKFTGEGGMPGSGGAVGEAQHKMKERAKSRPPTGRQLADDPEIGELFQAWADGKVGYSPPVISKLWNAVAKKFNMNTAAASKALQDAASEWRYREDYAKQFDESKHPRDESGEFGEKGGGAQKPIKRKPEEAQDAASYRQWQENAARVSADPEAATSTDLRRALGWFDAIARIQRHKAQQGETSNEELLIGIERELEWYKTILRQREKQSQYEKERYMLDPDEIKQLLDALDQLDWVQQMKTLAATQAGANATPAPMGEVPPPVPAAAPPAAPPMAAAPEAPPVEAPPEPPLGKGTLPAEGPPPEPPRSKFSAELDAMSDEDIEDYCRGRKIGKYAEEEGTVEDDDPGKPASNPTVETQGEPPKGSAHEEGSNPKDHFAREGEKERSVMNLGEVGHKLKDLEGQVAQLKAQLGEEQGKRIDAERYSALADRRQHYAFDLDKEVERCKYEKMTVDQFDQHIEVIEQNYRKIPVGESLPLHGRGIDRATAGALGVETETAKYQKEKADSAEALRISLDKAANGEVVDYASILADVKSRDGEPATK